MDKKIIVLLVIIAILSVGLGYSLLTLNHDTEKPVVINNTTTNNTVKNNTPTVEKTSTNSESGQYGYCAVCGKALSHSEATNGYTQGKVCHSCANNPYYQTGEGAKYANKKLEEAYPDEYGGSYENSADNGYYYEN